MNEKPSAIAEPPAAIAARVLRGSRRGLLCAAAGTAAAAALAACGGSGAGDGDTAPPPAGDGPASTTAPSTEDPGAAALAVVDDIPVGGGITTADLVLVRPAEDEVVAFSRTCPHKGSSVGAPENGTITCPSHGSTFKAADGSLLGGPATTGLTAVPVEVRDGEVFRA